MKPGMKRFLEQELPKLRPEWRQYISEEHKRGYLITEQTVDTWIGNSIVRDEDLRNARNRLKEAPLETYITADSSLPSLMLASTITEVNQMKSQIACMTGDRRKLGEFLLACCEELVQEVVELSEDGQIISLTTKSEDVQLPRMKEVLQKYSQELGNMDYHTCMTDIMEQTTNKQTAFGLIANMYNQVARGEDLEVVVVNMKRGEQETSSQFRGRVSAHVNRIRQESEQEGRNTEIANPYVFDYNGLLSRVAQREEFQEFSGLTIEQLADSEYRKEKIASGERRVPETIEFQVEPSEYISPEEIERQAQDGTERRERIARRYGYAKGIMGEGKKIEDALDVINGFNFKRKRDENQILQEDDKALIEDLKYLSFGQAWFDNSIGSVIDNSYVRFLKDHNMDIMDTIYIGQQTVREKYGELVKDLPPALAQEELKALVTVDMMRAEEPIQCVRFSERDDGNLYMDTISDVKRRITPFQKTKQERQAYQQKLDRVNDPEILARNRAILQWRNRELKEIQQEGRAVGDAHVQADWVRESSVQVTLPEAGRDLYGVWDQDSTHTVFNGVSKSEMFEQMFGDTLAELNEEYLKDQHIHHLEQLFYIDGKPVLDRRRYFDQDTARNNIMAALLSGEHRLSLAIPERDELGNVTIQIVDVQPNLHAMDGAEGIFERSRAKMSEALWKKDSEKPVRDAQIRDSMLIYLQETVQHQSKRTLYEEERKRWVLGDAGIAQGQRFMTGQYTTQQLKDFWGESKTVVKQPFDDILDDDKVEAMATKEEKEEARRWSSLYESAETPSQKATIRMLYTAKSAGILGQHFLRDGAPLEQFLYIQIMKEHPEIHLADLTKGGEPDPLSDLKEETGRKLVEKMGTVEGLGEVMADGFEWLSQLDLRREAEYAAGISENLSLEERRELMKQPGKDAAVTSFYAGMSPFIQGYWQIYTFSFHETGLVPRTDEEQTEKFPNENQRAVYQKIREKMTDADMAHFNHALAVGQRVSNANLIKRNAMLNSDDQGISEGDTIGAVEASILNDQMAEEGELHSVHMRTGVTLNTDSEIVAQMQSVSAEERSKILWGYVPEEWETIVREQGSQNRVIELTTPTEEMKEVIQSLETPFLKKATPVRSTTEQFSYDIESLSADAELSEAVKQGLEENHRKTLIVTNVQNEFLKKHPEIVEKGTGDTRDIQVMMDTEGLSDIQIRVQANAMVEDYYSSDPNRRKKVLDAFYDRVDAVNIFDWDLSVLTSNPPKTKEGIEKSEQDVLHMFQTIAYDQSILTKARENPAYFNERYADPKKRAHLDNYLNLMNALDLYAQSCVLYNSGMLQADMQRATEQDVHSLKQNAVNTAASVFQTSLRLYQEREDFLNGKEPATNIPFLATHELEKIVGIEKKTRPLDAATIRSASFNLQTYFGPMFKDSKQDWEDAGIEHLGQLFYIDGKSAEELFKDSYAHLPETQRQSAIQAEIMSALMKGESHVDMASFLRGPDGRLTVHMNAIHSNLHALDKAEKEQKHWYETANSKKAEKTWSSDKGREARLQAEKTALSEKMVAHMQKTMIEKQQREWVDAQVTAEAVVESTVKPKQPKKEQAVSAISIDDMMQAEHAGKESTRTKRKRSASVKAPTLPRLDMGGKQVKK